MNKYLQFLRQLYLNPKSLQSDFARSNAFFIAEGASRGHISSIIGGVSHNRWVVTDSGFKFIQEHSVEVYK